MNRSAKPGFSGFSSFRLLGLGLLLALAALPLAAWLLPLPALPIPAVSLYTALHLLIVVVGLLIFVVCWYTYELEPTGSMLLLAGAFLASGLLDFAHLLALFNDSGQLLTPTPASATIFAQAAQLIEGLTLLALTWRPYAPGRPWLESLTRSSNRYGVLAISLALVGLVYGLGQFYPALANQAAFTYLAGLIYLVSLGRLWLWRNLPRPPFIDPNYLLPAVLFLAGSLFCFYASLLLPGHLYKLLAYLLIGRAIFLTGLVNPMARLRQSEAALAHERYLLRTVIDNIPDYIYAKDTECRIVLSNNWNALAAAGTIPERLIGKTDMDLYSPELAAQFHADDLEVLRTGRPLINREEPGLDPAGRLRWVLTTKIQLTDDQGRVIGLVGIGRDITERKQMEAELQRLVDQTRHDAETKAILLDEVNHRVKNNLASIVGLLYAERRHASANGPVDVQTVINELITRIEGLAAVHKLLSASSWDPVPLDELARRLIEATQHALNLSHLVMLEISAEPVRINPRQASSLGMLLNELALNSIKHALPGRPGIHLFLDITLDGAMVQLIFRDDGPGFPEEVLRFERHNVGLYLVQNLVRTDLGGQVELANRPGATVILRFKTG